MNFIKRNPIWIVFTASWLIWGIVRGDWTFIVLAMGSLYGFFSQFLTKVKTQ